MVHPLCDNFVSVLKEQPPKNRSSITLRKPVCQALQVQKSNTAYLLLGWTLSVHRRLCSWRSFLFGSKIISHTQKPPSRAVIVFSRLRHATSAASFAWCRGAGSNRRPLALPCEFWTISSPRRTSGARRFPIHVLIKNRTGTPFRDSLYTCLRHSFVKALPSQNASKGLARDCPNFTNGVPPISPSFSICFTTERPEDSGECSTN